MTVPRAMRADATAAHVSERLTLENRAASLQVRGMINRHGGTHLATARAMSMLTGKVGDRPFGQTLGSLAQTRVTGQLSVTTCEGTYSIAFNGGHVVAASSPLRADSAAAIAVTHDLITPGQQIAIEHMLASLLASDELEACATIAQLTPDEVHRLRRRAIAQRAARILALRDGRFLVSSEITLPVMPDSEIHVGGVIYQGACAYLGAPELAAIVARLGSRFTLRSDAFDELPYLGLGEREAGVVGALARGISIDELAAIPRPADWHRAHAAVYALASCGSLEREQSQDPLHARGTSPPVEVGEPPNTKTSAAEAYARGQRALGAERLAEAVYAFQRAVELEPKDVGYITALAWARFCHAHDKHGVAAETRKVLSMAIARSTTPLLPHYYLGVVERILDRKEAALEHFQEVLELAPDHPEASAEVRCLLRAKRRTEQRP